MNLSKCRNADGSLLTVQQTCERFNLGSSTVRRLAKEAGAVRRIGRIYRINPDTLYRYIEEVYGD